jgi:hypothetical protein
MTPLADTAGVTPASRRRFRGIDLPYQSDGNQRVAGPEDKPHIKGHREGFCPLVQWHVLG